MPVLVDIRWQGRAAQGDALGEPERLLLRARPHDGAVPVGQAVREGDLGRRLRRERPADSCARPGADAEGTLVYPGNQGGTNWYTPSYSPRTGLFYVPGWVNYASLFIKRPQTYVEGQYFGGGRRRATDAQGLRTAHQQSPHEDEGYGADPRHRSADRAAEVGLQDDRFHRRRRPDDRVGSAVQRRARRLFLRARRAHRRARCGTFAVGGQVQSGPMTYSVDGRQYVAVYAGSSLFAFALRP